MPKKKLLSMPRIVLAGVSSGSGKTTIAAGLMAALRERGMRVQGFKTGPDYIDPSYHTLASGLPSRNLDSWMLSHETVLELFQRVAVQADLSIIEGVMGLFDGHSGTDEAGSTAELAKILKAPIILVIDVSGLGRSAAAIVFGCLKFDPALNICGVIVNNVGSKKHLLLVKEAIEQKTSIPVLGFLPRDRDVLLKERHLGLIPVAEQKRLTRKLFPSLSEKIARSIAGATILEIARNAPPLEAVEPRIFPKAPVKKRVKLGVARDEAFSFYYQDNLDLLEAYGAELVFFSPLHNDRLPDGIQGLYLGGGFPEIYARRLSENKPMRRAIKNAGKQGMPIYAECGGLMYLAKGIIDLQGRKQPMVGLMPGWTDLLEMRLKLAYVTMKGSARNPLARDSGILRGHEFHYSELSLPSSYKRDAAWNILEPASRPEGFLINNILASYVHLHFAAHPSLAPNFVTWCAGEEPD